MCKIVHRSAKTFVAVMVTTKLLSSICFFSNFIIYLVSEGDKPPTSVLLFSGIIGSINLVSLVVTLSIIAGCVHRSKVNHSFDIAILGLTGSADFNDKVERLEKAKSIVEHILSIELMSIRITTGNLFRIVYPAIGIITLVAQQFVMSLLAL